MRRPRSAQTRLMGMAAVAFALTACGSTVSLGANSNTSSLNDSGLGAGSTGAQTSTTTATSTVATTDRLASPAGAPSDGAVPAAGDNGSTSPDGTPAVSTVLKPVKIGYVVYDTAGFTAVTGNSDAGQNSSANQAADHFEMESLVKYANATGGVNGRKIAPPIGYRLTTTDALNAQTLAAVCAKATEDDKVEAFIDRSFMVSDDLLTCFARHKVDLASFLVLSSDDILKRSAPYVATTQPTIERSAKAFVEGVIGSGYLTKGAVVGVVADDSKAVDNALNAHILPALKAAGFPAKVIVRTSSTDSSATTSQGSAAVLKMRSAGVTHVVWFANFLAQLAFANGATSQNYYPRYAWSDYAGGVGDAGFYLSAEQNKNSIAVSVLPLYVVNPEDSKRARTLTDPVDRNKAEPGVRRCLDAISKYGGRNYYAGNAGRSTDYAFLCDHFLLWLDAARLAPKPFATSLFAGGVHALRATHDSVLVHATDFTTRLSGASNYRVGLFSPSGCKCWSAITPWRAF